MKIKTSLTLLALVSAASIIAQPSTYTAAEATKHVGETATVSDKVDGVHQSGKGNIFLNMGGKYPNQAFMVSWAYSVPNASNFTKKGATRYQAGFYIADSLSCLRPVLGNGALQDAPDEA